MDFSAEQYISLLKSIQGQNIPFYTFRDYMNGAPEIFAIMRHDVDRAPGHALKMAKIESKLGIQTTYYFRYKNKTFKRDLIKEINEYGHEIGYHYENLSDCKGDYQKAIQSFKEILGEFRKLTDIETISMHGKPLSRINNQWLWNKYDFKEYGITCEPYLTIDYSKIAYFTDAGRRWNAEKVNFRDKVRDAFNYKVKSSNDIIDLIESPAKPKGLIINVHPENWAFNKFQWSKIFFVRELKNKIKYIIHFIDQRN